jgi:hypothetical protein
MQCPGQDSRYWDGEAIFESRCPKCGSTVEFFKDDSKRRCRQCGHELLNPRIDFGCASYCPFAEQCLGSLPPEMLAHKQELLIDRVALEMKRLHGHDFAKIGQATRAARFAAELAKSEEANKTAVTLAAYLAEVDSGMDDAAPRETRQARALLAELKTNEGLTNEVCDLIQYLGPVPAADAQANAKVFHDAWLLARIAPLGKEPATSNQARELALGLTTANGRLAAEKLMA